MVDAILSAAFAMVWKWLDSAIPAAMNESFQALVQKMEAQIISRLGWPRTLFGQGVSIALDQWQGARARAGLWSDPASAALSNYSE